MDLHSRKPVLEHQDEVWVWVLGDHSRIAAIWRASRSDDTIDMLPHCRHSFRDARCCRSRPPGWDQSLLEDGLCVQMSYVCVSPLRGFDVADALISGIPSSSMISKQLLTG